VLSQPIKSIMKRRNLVTAPPRTTVRKAAEMMARRRVGAIVVVDHDQLVGIFSERDAVLRVIARGLEPAKTVLADVMTPAPVTIAPNKSFGHAMSIMHQRGFRHLPVVDNGRPIGIVSSRSALDPELEEFACEERRRLRFDHG